jgi:hypothetical protein
MTGGTALPADVNPPAPGASDLPGGTGQPDAPGSPQDRQPEGKLPGLPRLFFAEQELDPQTFGQQPTPEQPALQLPSHYGTAAPPARVVMRGQRRGPSQAGQGFGAGQSGPGQAEQRSAGVPGHRGLGGVPRPAERPPGPATARSRKPPERELRQRGFASLLFGVMSLIAIIFGFGPDPGRGIYLVAFSSLVGIAAIVIGVSALVKARRTGSYRPRGVIGGIGLGVLATVISLLFGVLYLAYPHQMQTYVSCVEQAQTAGQKQACLNQLENAIRASVPSSGQRGWTPANRLALVLIGRPGVQVDHVVVGRIVVHAGLRHGQVGVGPA